MAWVDRPQGLVAAYRLVAATGWDPTVPLLAIAAAAMATAGVGAAAWALAGRRAAVVAAALFAVLSPAPHLEGFTANGELLASGFTAIAVAAVAWWWVRADRRLLFLAGLAGALGLLMKQSAFDGLVVALVVVLAGHRAVGRRTGRDLAALCAGIAVPAVLAVAARGHARVRRVVVRDDRPSEPDGLDHPRPVRAPVEPLLPLARALRARTSASSPSWPCPG